MTTAGSGLFHTARILARQAPEVPMPCQNSAVSSPRVPQLEMSVLEAVEEVAVAETSLLDHFHVKFFAVPRNLAAAVVVEEA